MGRSASGNPDLATNEIARPPNARTAIAASTAIRRLEAPECRGRKLAALRRASSVASAGLDVTVRFADLSFLPFRPLLRANGSAR
jgi:hypothetical protein